MKYRGLNIKILQLSRYLSIIFIIAMYVVTGCDHFHTLQFENNTQSTLSVIAEGTGEQIVVDSCSVVWRSWFGGPGPKQAVAIKAYYQGTYEMAYSGEIIPRYEHGVLVYKVILTGSDPHTCPSPITGQYQVIITNKSKKSISATLNNKLLGEVKPGGTIIIGPIKGDIKEYSNIDLSPIYEPDDINRNLHIWANKYINYTIGKTPTLQITINDVS
jgi:hypothetical protein